MNKESLLQYFYTRRYFNISVAFFSINLEEQLMFVVIIILL